MIRLIMIICLAFVAGGCTSVYFYETEKVSLTLEGRPDPTAPLSGNLGLKQRVVLIAPAARTKNPLAAPASAPENGSEPKTDAEKAASLKALAEKAGLFGKGSGGDALSVINSFRFQIHAKEPGQVFPRMTIDGALITGEPASSLGQAATTRAIGALSGVDVSPVVSNDIAVLRLMFSGLKTLQSQASPGSAQRSNMDELMSSLNRLDDLAPATYTVLMFDSIENGQFKARPGKALNDPVRGEKGFDRVLTYWADLDLSITRLQDLRDDAAKPEVERLAAGQKIEEVKRAKETLERNLRASTALNQLRDFWREIGG